MGGRLPHEDDWLWHRHQRGLPGNHLPGIPVASPLYFSYRNSWGGRGTGVGKRSCASHVACQRHALFSGPAMVAQAVLLSQWCYVYTVTQAGWLADQPQHAASRC